MQKSILYILLAVSCVAVSCDKEATSVKKVPEIDFAAITFQQTDQKRLCLADLIAKSFANDELRARIKMLSGSDIADKHREIWVWELLNDPVFKNAIEIALKSGKSRCYATFGDFKNDLLSDPSLVLKIPDLIDLRKWDTAKQEPFLYVRTNDYVKKNPLADTVAIIGFHSSGLTDYYFGGVPTYLPVVLKSSEDHLLINKGGSLYNGVKFSTLHDVSENRLANLNFGQKSLENDGKTCFFVSINELIHQINQSDGSFIASFQAHPCTEPCVFACTPETDRRLAFDHIFIDNQNPNTIEYVYTNIFRANSHWILYDNIVPAIYYSEIKNGGQVVSKHKRILGSFRMNDFFAVKSSTTLIPEMHQVDCENITLCRLDAIYEVTDLKKIPSEPILLTDRIVENGTLQLSMVRLYFDQLSNPFPTYSGDPVLVNKFYSDNVLIYLPYCPPGTNIFGFNSVAIQLKY